MKRLIEWLRNADAFEPELTGKELEEWSNEYRETLTPGPWY